MATSITTIQSTDLITNSRADINNNFDSLLVNKIETDVLTTDSTFAAASDSKIPSQLAVKQYVDAGGNVNASEVSAGIVEESTDDEMDSASATGATGAKLFITPAKLANFFSGFGDGSDGALAISSGTTTLSADKQYTSVSVTGTAILETAGYRIYCQGTVTVDANSGACIRNNGGNGGDASGSTGGTAGTVAPGVTVPAGIVGFAGANGQTGAAAAGVNGTAGTNITLGIGVIGAVGGAGGMANAGTRVGGTGGAAGTFSASINKLATIADSNLIDHTGGTFTFVKGDSGSGSGASGGHHSGTNSGAGGGSGASGGCVFIAAKSFVLSGTGAIQAKGGNGGAGSNGSSDGSNGGGGGGAGGSGGQIILIYHFKTGVGTLVVTGGTAGAKGLASATGSNADGVDGAVGTTGKTYLIQI